MGILVDVFDERDSTSLRGLGWSPRKGYAHNPKLFGYASN